MYAGSDVSLQIIKSIKYTVVLLGNCKQLTHYFRPGFLHLIIRSYTHVVDFIPLCWVSRRFDSVPVT